MFSLFHSYNHALLSKFISRLPEYVTCRNGEIQIFRNSILLIELLFTYNWKPKEKIETAKEFIIQLHIHEAEQCIST